MKMTTPKLWLFAALAVSALTLGACEDKGSKTSEDDPNYDVQTEIEQEATGVDEVEQVTEGVNSTGISDDPLVNDDVATDDDVATATVDDSEVLDGSESEEHVSTY